VGVFYGSVFFNLEQGSACGNACYADRTALFYFGLMLMCMGHLNSLRFLINDRVLFYRERGSRAYGPVAYAVSVSIPPMLAGVLNVLVFSLATYYMAGLRGVGGNTEDTSSGRGDVRHYFGVYYAFLLVTNYLALFFGYTIACISSSTVVALSLFPCFMGLNAIYAGYLVNIPTLTYWQKVWIPYVVFFRYSFQGLVLNEFDGNDALPGADALIDALGFDTLSISTCFAVLVLFLVFFMGAMVLALKYLDFEKR
jgi:hypothetical protein